MAVVVDANLLVALATRSPARLAVRTKLAEWSEAGEDLHAPWLIRYEVANALTGVLAAGRISDEQLDEAWEAAMATEVELHDLTNGPAIVRIAAALRRRSAYDAADIALANELGAALWTLDGPLARNATEAGLPVRLVETG